MTLENLDNLVKVGQLKKEPPDQAEIERLIKSAERRLQDAEIEGLSEEGRFSMAYGAAHALATAALRWHGYRSDNRYLVFQCLQHTLEMEQAQVRLLALCHNKRNLAEYEGQLEVSPGLINELVEAARNLLLKVRKLKPIK